jgi:threonine dehydratase
MLPMTAPLPTFDDVLAARRRLGALALRTAVVEHPALNARAAGRVLLKAENLQRVGAFKFRGAYNKIAQIDPGGCPGGVVACSSGNHAQGVAAAATLLGLKSLIVMPSDAPALKIARTKAFGAEVRLYDRETEDRDAIALGLCEERRAVFVHPFDDPDVIAGQGTAALELMEQVDALGLRLDAVLAPCSGGGLVTGTALSVKQASPDTSVYSVEPEGFDDMARSLASGSRQKNTRLSGSLCDALMAPSPGTITFELARRLLAGGLVVSEQEVREAVRFAFGELKLVLEPGGAAALAAVLSGKIETAGKTTACILSGGNVDGALFGSIVTGH